MSIQKAKAQGLAHKVSAAITGIENSVDFTPMETTFMIGTGLVGIGALGHSIYSMARGDHSSAASGIELASAAFLIGSGAYAFKVLQRRSEHNALENRSLKEIAPEGYKAEAKKAVRGNK